VISPEDRLAAFSLVWLYPHNQTAEIDPLGKHPDYRQRGLSGSLVAESFKRMRARGANSAYFASETDDQVVSRLYASFQPVECDLGYHWSMLLA
jgi:ribosomal protein S18 acetylase RimI-like enzyme